MASAEPKLIQVGDLLVDLDRARVTRAGAEIPLPRLSFDLLLALVDASPRVVTLDELMQRVWANLVVSPETVSQRVKLLRRALDDNPDYPRYIAGVRGRGYRLVPPVERSLAPQAMQTPGVAQASTSVAPDQDEQSLFIRAGQRHTLPDLLGRRLVVVAVAGLVTGLILAIGIGLSDRPALDAGDRARDTDSHVTVADLRPSIAVLPFDNRSGQDEDSFFVDGIHDDILTQLTKISTMKVVSRLSVERFRNAELPLRNIAGQLGVTTILQGGVQRAGDRVRITVQLVDAATDTQLWAEHYDRELTAANIFAIQTEVAIAIAAALRTTLTPVEKATINAVPTRILAAWEAWQLGKQRIASRNSRQLEEAGHFMRQAIDLDPGFALAYAGLAQALTLQAVYGGAPLDDALAPAERAAVKALALDSNLAEAWGILGLIAEKRGRHDDAETLYRRAIALNPNFAVAYLWLAGSRNMIAHPEEAVGYSQRAVELDPLSAFTRWAYASSLYSVGRFAEAERRLRELLESDPGFAPTYVMLAIQSAYAGNRFTLAVPLVTKATELDPKNPVAAGSLIMLRTDLGDLQAKDAIEFAERSAAAEVSERAAENAALACLYHGDHEQALRYARQALAANPQSRIALALLGQADQARGDHPAARARYEKAGRLYGRPEPDHVDPSNYGWAIDFAAVLQRSGETRRARELLERSERAIARVPKLGFFGYGIADVQILALRGDKAKALATLRQAELAGWRGPFWRYYRDFDPNLASIRNEPEFKALFAEIDRDMARQRVVLATRPKPDVRRRP